MSVHPPLPAQPDPDEVALARKYRYITTLLLLLISVSIVSLVSIVIPPRATQATSRAIPQPTAPHAYYADGRCDASPKSVPYLTPTSVTALSPAWLKAGLAQQDFLNAQACAATFVTYYETFDASNLKTLESAAYMLSSDAKTHFYQGKSGEKDALHMQSTWRATLQKQQRKQVAHVARVVLQTLQARGGKLFVQMQVAYLLLEQNNGHVQFASDSDLVQLALIPPDAHQQAAAWQVVAWSGRA